MTLSKALDRMGFLLIALFFLVLLGTFGASWLAGSDDTGTGLFFLFLLIGVPFAKLSIACFVAARVVDARSFARSVIAEGAPGTMRAGLVCVWAGWTVAVLGILLNLYWLNWEVVTGGIPVGSLWVLATAGAAVPGMLVAMVGYWIDGIRK